MMRLLWLGGIAALLVTALALSGCGGGADDGVTPTTEPTGTIAGRVVRADNVSSGVPSAEVSIASSGTSGVGTAQAVSTTTDGQGNFTLRNVPVGAQTVVVQATSDPSLRSQTVPAVPVRRDETSPLTVTLLRFDQALPALINLSPTRATVDLFGQVKFTATVSSGATALQATPTFVLTEKLGTISPSGLFTATSEGTTTLSAYAGEVSATARITVTGSRPPEITTFLASPLEFTASGGVLTVTAAINDGDGVLLVVAEIFTPASPDPVRRVMSLTAGTDKDGTYRATWDVPGNSNAPDGNGVQAPVNYSVRVVATDGASETTTSAFVDFVVKGLRPPPPPI